MVEPKIAVQQDEVGNTARLLKEPVTGQKINECFERMEKHLSEIAKGSWEKSIRSLRRLATLVWLS
jgi:hypothetical protein